MILTVTMNPAIDKIYMIDNYQIGEVHRPSDMIASAGGKGLNVARVAKLMGEEVSTTGPLGGGNGAYIKKEIEKLGIKPHFCDIEGETRICINITDVINQQCTEILESGPTLNETEVVNQLVQFEALIDQVDVVVISGSLAEGLPVDFYGKLISIAKTKAKKVLLDCSGEAFIEGVKMKPYAIKPNETEIAAIYEGYSETIENKLEAIKFFKDQGIELPIISMGGEGSLAGLEDGIYKISLPPVEVINTVGSGDSFMAGLAISIQRGLDKKTCMKMATACGTANTQYRRTGYVEPETVDWYMRQVTIEKIAEY
ncbi:MAG: 1-phosphofructokinase [Firmicutes bacterium HGW-Firmicutes-7]|nr:MAG: 1-phosphofructokinase [Firmicutes bacterium HGW-Firmicutes-7]